MIIIHILEDLYNAIIVSQRRPARTGSPMHRLLTLSMKNDEQLRSMLTEEQQKQFEKCVDCSSELSMSMEYRAFSDGFCLAIKLMVEVMNTMDVPSVDD